MVVKEIEATKNNKSTGVDGIPTKLLMQTVEHISIQRLRVFNFNTKVFNNTIRRPCLNTIFLMWSNYCFVQGYN